MKEVIASPLLRPLAARAMRGRSTSAAAPLKRAISPLGDTSIAAPVTAAYERTCGARERARSERNGDSPFAFHAPSPMTRMLAEDSAKSRQRQK